MRRRLAFTLVEMMVSMALVIFIMIILTQAFVAGLETFRQLKAIGDMEEKLRVAASLLRRDLSADHFSDGRRLSTWDWSRQVPPGKDGAGGFFRLWQGSPTFDPRNAVVAPAPGSPYATAPQSNVVEGYDSNSPASANVLASYRSTNHILHFSVRLGGNTRQDFVSAVVPTQVSTNVGGSIIPTYSPLLYQDAITRITPGTGAPYYSAVLDQTTDGQQSSDMRYQDNPYVAPTGAPPGTVYSPAFPLPPPSVTATNYNTPWFEVAYFLRQTGTTVVPNPAPGATGLPGIPLYSLYRRQLAVTPDNVKLNFSNFNATAPCQPPVNVLNAAEHQAYAEMSCKKLNPASSPPYPDQLWFNNPNDLTIPPQRFGMLPAAAAATAPAGLNNYNVGVSSYPRLGEPGAFNPLWQDNPLLQGADVLLTNVISFDVRVLLPESLARMTTFGPSTGNSMARPDLDPFVDLFDSAVLQEYYNPTGAKTAAPLPVLCPYNYGTTNPNYLAPGRSGSCTKPSLSVPGYPLGSMA